VVVRRLDYGFDACQPKIEPRLKRWGITVVPV
jgi:hypothetical protein